MINIFNMDCMDLLKETPDKHFDIAIVDPPYGINAHTMQMGQNLNRKDGWQRGHSTAVKLKKGRLNSGGGIFKSRALNTMNCNWDYKKPTQEYFDQLFRVSKHQIIWGGNYFGLPATRCVLCWDKKQPWENFSQWEMAWTSFDKPAGLFSYATTGGNNLDKKIHPTQKPIALYKWIYERYVQPGWTILDTHLGSGSNAIVAEKLGHDFTGCEIDLQHYTDAMDRIKARTELGIFDRSNEATQSTIIF